MTLLCPVRGCGAALARVERSLGCPRGHRFDLARSGYCNLLQPQDRRSRQPGDSPAAVAARRRLFDRGHGDWLVPSLLAALAKVDEIAEAAHFASIGESTGLSDISETPKIPETPETPESQASPENSPIGASGRPSSESRAAVLDVGCGEGFYLGTLARLRPMEAHGLDLSASAVDLAARRYPRAAWVVANADRFLPYAAGSFDLAMSLTARLNPAELRRLLVSPTGGREEAANATREQAGRGRRGGFLLIAVPGADDLVELRAAVLGEGRLRERLEAAISALGGDFELVHRAQARHRLRLSPPDLRDLLAATYRGGRHRENRLGAVLGELEVTVSRDLGIFRPRLG